jgi:hypothetical protein
MGIWREGQEPKADNGCIMAATSLEEPNRAVRVEVLFTQARIIEAYRARILDGQSCMGWQTGVQWQRHGLVCMKSGDLETSSLFDAVSRNYFTRTTLPT